MTGKGKKAVSVILTAGILAGAAAGIAVAVRKTTSSSGTALVVSVNDLNYGGYWDSTQTMAGQVTTEAMQNVYLTDTETVAKVNVKEGQTVKKGDVLLEYDTSKTALGLEKEKLNLEQIQLNMKVAQKNLETLKSMKPVTDSEGVDGYDDGADDTGDQEETKDTNARTYANLTDASAALNEKDESAGTQENPLRYLCLEQTTIQPSFLSMLQKKAEGKKLETVWFSLEVHAESSPDSPILRMWLGDSASLAQQLQDQNTLKIDLAVAQACTVLDDKAVAYNEDTTEENLGSQDHPYRYLVRNGVEIILQPSFFTMLQEKSAGMDSCWFLLEAHEGDKVTGRCLQWNDNGTSRDRTWGADARKMETDQEIRVSFEGEGQPVQKQQDPSGTPVPEPTQTPSASTAPEGSSSGENAAEDAAAQQNTSASSGQNEENQTDSAAPASLRSARTAELPEGETASLRVRRLPEAAVLLSDTDSGISAAGGAADSGTSDGARSSSGVLSGGTDLIPSDASYTKEEIANAKKQQEQSLKDLALDEKESQLKIRMTQEALDSGTVTAKIDGTVSKAGDPKSPPQDGSAFLQVRGTEGAYVEGGLPELLLGKVKDGDTVTVTSWQTGNTYQAEIRDISPYPDTSGIFDTGSMVSQSYYPFIAYISDGDAQLKEGESLNIQLNAQDQIQDSTDSTEISLDKAFIREDEKGKYVMKRGKDGKLVRQDIQTGKMEGSSYVIKDGLSTEDWVAFPYGKTAAEGTKTREASLEELFTS